LLTRQILADRARALKPTLQTYVLPWLTKASWSWDIAREARIEMEYLEKEGGRFEDWKVDAGVGMTDARPVVEGYS
jgi:phosphatidylglycerol phospholipase C